MKRFNFLFIIALCLCLSISCKNNKATKQAEQAAANQEVIDATMPILADNILATLDSLSNLYINSVDPLHKILQFTEEELLVKPTYLLEPDQTKDLLDFSQKSYAFAELVTQLPIREKFKLPTDESKAETARLAAELNLNEDIFTQQPDKPISEKIKESYNWYKEQNRLNDFWIMANNFIDATYFLGTQHINALVRALTPEMGKKLDNRLFIGRKALWTLIKYDSRVEDIFKLYDYIDEGPEGYIEADSPQDNRYSYDLDGLKQYLTDIKEKAEEVRKQRLNIK